MDWKWREKNRDNGVLSDFVVIPTDSTIHHPERKY
jgi:hypothetical protein